MTKIIGLTGGIGSGKSTVAKHIASKGIPVYIADDEAKKIMTKKSVIQEIQNLFEENIILEDGQLDRKKIASIVFQAPSLLKKLNEVVHPKVKKHFEEWLKKHKDAPFIVKEVAILFETGGNLDCDKVILVTTPDDIKINRVMQRDNVNREEVIKRMKNQLSDAEKSKKSDFVVTNVKIEDTLIAIDEILNFLKIS
ncbi:dephospho-CoA kinase [Flavobacterium jejuense]|uniref:Dephospho-CoA kinase n=1 Tax=Flavobacterium jejuense TaxID=1544455 RepID=A0ABX0IYK2_9FLAO|nr:dephospho-CoA kinase [Flavobacterium jejuense]NHN27807.1 dephospho-CoA kinase [Flavobacterium jejuense]